MQHLHNVRLVAVPCTDWGHTRPLLAFIPRLLRYDPLITVSLILASRVAPQCRDELDRHIRDQKLSDEDAARVQIMEINCYMVGGMEADFGAPLKQAFANLTSSPDTHPHVLLLDFQVHMFASVARAIATGPIRVMTWHPISMAFMGSEPIASIAKVGGVAFSESVKADALNKNIPVEDAAFETFISMFSGAPQQPPGLPVLSDYESYPQEPPFKFKPAMDRMVSFLQAFEECDALVTSSSRSLEGAAFEWIEEWLSKSKAPVFGVGPLLPAIDESASHSSRLEKFLNRVQAERGAQTVLFISFGSTFYPEQPDKLYSFLSAVVELDIPFVLVHPTTASALSESINSARNGFISPWVDQPYVLSHPVVGAFLSHCGLNGSLEGLIAGVPFITWPLCADQPILSILVTQVLGCGIELNEVRRGYGLKHRLSTGSAPRSASFVQDNILLLTPENAEKASETSALQLDEIKKEAKGVLCSMFLGDERDKYKISARKVASSLGSSWEYGGVALKDALAFISYLHQIV